MSSIFIQYVREYVKASRLAFNIVPGSLHCGGDDLGATGEFLAMLAHARDGQGEVWSDLKKMANEPAKRSDVLEFIVDDVRRHPALLTHLPPDYLSRLSLLLEPNHHAELVE